MNQTAKIRLGSAELAARLRREITDGLHQPRDRLPSERRLADRFGVARGTVHQALALLAAEGRVLIRPGSGSYVAAPAPPLTVPAVDNARPLELIDARFALEPHLCRLAVLHARAQDIEQAEALLARMEASRGDPAAFSAGDTAFHTWLAEVTANALLIWICGQINAVRRREEWSRMLTLTLSEAIITEYNIQHRQIVDAIRDRDPERAATLMKQHLETARLSLTRAAET